MTEDELTPYVGQRVTLHLHQSRFPVGPPSGVLSIATTSAPDSSERIAVLTNEGIAPITVSLPLILTVTTTTPSDAAAFAGWACNPNAPIPERLKCAQVALDYYVDQQDKLHEMLEQYETLIADEADELGYYERMYARPVYRDIRDRLRLILGVGDDQDEDATDG